MLRDADLPTCELGLFAWLYVFFCLKFEWELSTVKTVYKAIRRPRIVTGCFSVTASLTVGKHWWVLLIDRIYHMN
jgi:hypothetical protein